MEFNRILYLQVPIISKPASAVFISFIGKTEVLCLRKWYVILMHGQVQAMHKMTFVRINGNGIFVMSAGIE